MSADIAVPHFYRPMPRTGDALPACADCLSVPTDPTFAEHHEPSRIGDKLRVGAVVRYRITVEVEFIVHAEDRDAAITKLDGTGALRTIVNTTGGDILNVTAELADD